METNALDDAKTKVNVDHNKALNGNKVELRKRGIVAIPVVEDDTVTVLKDADTTVTVKDNKIANDNH
ncbi:hypothetical protein G6F57_004477 [Rhizopus arrhizus]|nr:hypothetical protein G6F24_006224 [Rhizopus arrhizus]KAG0808032.1 hypothetical protein G6F20_009902 [Rhizopus arrhizus]KAG0836331.1 hypothetical protein G6F19_004281 [Rhizopus arrhizus]KAG0893233.1 hypothetical protein G6F34_010168 [Rhizopus arrhizus]KAG1308445.1 hypothetical protein G6F62_015032 [Rhizopus arrhizus]